MSSRNKRVNILLDQKKRDLIKQAKPFGVTFPYSSSNKRQIAEFIVDRQDEQQKPEPQQVAESGSVPGQPDFESLTETEDVSIRKETRGGFRPGAGRPEGQTELHTKVEQCRAIKKSDPTVFFFVSGLFSYWSLRTKVPELASECDEPAENLALSITKFVKYQWPDLQIDPRLEFGAGIGKELRSAFLWGKDKIDKANAGSVDSEPISAEDISEEVYPDKKSDDPGTS